MKLNIELQSTPATLGAGWRSISDRQYRRGLTNELAANLANIWLATNQAQLETRRNPCTILAWKASDATSELRHVAKHAVRARRIIQRHTSGKTVDVAKKLAVPVAKLVHILPVLQEV